MHIVFARQSFDCFDFNERDGTAGAGMIRISAGLREIAIAFESTARDASDGGNALHRSSPMAGDMQRDSQSLLRHDSGDQTVTLSRASKTLSTTLSTFSSSVKGER